MESNVKSKYTRLLGNINNILRYILSDYSDELIKNLIELKKWYRLSKYRWREIR